MLGHHKSIAVGASSEYAKELQKHEALHTQFGPPGRPYVYREFPKRLYRATRRETGNGIDYEGFTVNDEHEERNMQSRGFALSQSEALEALTREQTEHGKLAAERNFEIARGRISERAAKEVRAAEADHTGHLPEVTAKPIRRRGPNKPKVGANVV
jgi:hypothetical protein